VTSTTNVASLFAHSLNNGAREIQAREELRQAMRDAGYPADRCINELAAGHPLQVVMRRHGYDPIARRHPGAQRKPTVAELLTAALQNPKQ